MPVSALPRYLILACLGLALPALAAEPGKEPRGTLVDFNVEARQTAANDQGSALAFMEAEATSPSELAQKVNGAIAQALAVTKEFSTVQTRSGNTWTSPIYGKNGHTIEGWRMRSELQLESRDIPALATLLGKLQGTLGVNQINLHPARETRAKAEDAATTAAIHAFRDKARKIAGQLGKDYRIVQLNVGSNNGIPGPAAYAMKSVTMRAEMAPMPLEGGESLVTVSVSGQIEVLP